MGYYYHSQNAQDSKDVLEAQQRIEGGEDPDVVKASYDSRLSGRIALAVAPPKTYYSNKNPVEIDGKLYQRGAPEVKAYLEKEQAKLEKDVAARGIIVKSDAKETGGIYLDGQQVGTATYKTVYTPVTTTTKTQETINQPIVNNQFTPNGRIDVGTKPAQTWDQKALKGLKSFSSGYSKYDPLALRGVAAGVISIPIGIAGAITHPVRTVKSLYEVSVWTKQASNPAEATFQIGEGIKQDLLTRPTYVFGQGLGIYVAGKIIGKASQQIVPKGKITAVQGQKIAAVTGEKGQKVIVQAKFNVNVGKKTFKVDSVGKEYAININNKVQSTSAGFKFQSGITKALQTNKGIRVLGKDTVASVTQYKHVTILKEKGTSLITPKKVSYSYGQKVTKTDLIIQDQGLNTYSTIGIQTGSKAKILPFSKLGKAFKKTNADKTKFDTLEVGRIKEVAKVDDITYSQALLKEVKGAPAVKILSKYKNKPIKPIAPPPKALTVFKKTSGIAGTTSQQATITGGVSETIGALRTGAIKTAAAVYKQQAKPIPYTIQTTAVLTATRLKLSPKITTRTKTETSTKTNIKTSTKTETAIKTTTELDSIQLTKVGLGLEQKQQLAQRQAVDLKQNLATITIQTPITRGTPILNTGTPPPAAPLFKLPEQNFYKKRNTAISSFNQKKAFSPTARSIALNIRGKTSKAAIKTGLGDRFIPIQPKKKYRGFF